MAVHHIPSHPYPASYDRRRNRITGFTYDSPLILARAATAPDYLRKISREEQYVVYKNYQVTYWLDRQKQPPIVVPRGTLTDLASVPQIFRCFLGRVGPHLEASVVHDYLYVAWQINNLSPSRDMRHFTEDLMLEAMLQAKMKGMAKVIHWVTDRCGKKKFHERDPHPLRLSESQLEEMDLLLLTRAGLERGTVPQPDFFEQDS